MDGMGWDGMGRDGIGWYGVVWHEGVGVEATTHKGAGIWKGWWVQEAGW